MRLLATLEDIRVVEQILTHLGLPSKPVRAERERARVAQPPTTENGLSAYRVDSE